MPSTKRLYVWILVALVFQVIIVMRARREALSWDAFTDATLFLWCAAIQVTAAIKLVYGRPVLEVTTGGIRLNGGGFGSLKTYAPWERIEGIFLTQTLRNRPAIGFDILEDAHFCLPAQNLFTPRLHPIARHASIALEFGPWAYAGDVTEWAAQLETWRQEWSQRTSHS
jgi:hypothetical protein